MKTIIKTKDLLNLINPIEDGINYKGNHIKIDLSILKEYILHPKSKNILQNSDNIEDNLYKNLALYIINTQQDFSISLDLDKNSIINGNFEYIKAIYNNKANIHINLPEIGDNALLIKTKKLKETDIEIENATDSEYSGLSSIFSETTKFDLDKDNIKGKFFWQENGSDIFSDKNWLLEKIKQIILNHDNLKTRNVKEQNFSNDIQNLIEKIEPNLLTDEFKIELLTLNNHALNIYMITNYDTFNLDFNKPIFKDFLDQQLKNNNFSLLGLLFEQKKESLYNINYHYFFNQSNALQHILTKRYLYTYRQSLSIVTAYEYLSDENKRDKSVVLTYLEKIKDDAMSNDAYYPEGLFYQIPLDVFKDEEILAKIFSKISLDKFISKTQEQKIDIPLFRNKEFIFNHVQKISNRDINFLITNCLNKEQINKDFIKKLLSLKPSLLDTFSHTDNFYSHLVINNIDVIMEAGRFGDKIGHNHLRLLINHFLVDGTKEEEEFKLNVIIKNKIDVNSNVVKHYYSNSEDRIKFKNKYLKLEYLFFRVDKHFDYIDTKFRNKALAKIKNPEDIYTLMEKIHSFNVEANVDYRAIYKNLNPVLKNNISLLEKTGLLENIKFQDLPESLHYNKKIVLKFINENANDIPVEFFNDSNFCLEYAKKLDGLEVSLDKSPKFIIKFFENQGVTQDFHQYLKSYIEMTRLNVTLNNETNKSSKKLKI